MKNSTISFLGAGNMASSIIGGLLDNGIDPSRIVASDPNEESLGKLKQQYSISITTSNVQAVSSADVVVLAVKPQVLVAVCEEVAPAFPASSLCISIAAGITTARISASLGQNRAIVRCMPNTPALVQQGASVLFANNQASETQKQLAEDMLTAVGTVNWITEEALMDAVTAVSGSGPAYIFLVIEAMTEAGVKLGLEKDVAATLAQQTAYGAALLAKESTDDVAELRRKVTSPNGTTEQAILSFEKNKLRDIFMQAMTACAERSHELGNL